MTPINNSSSWETLNNHFEKTKSIHMRDLFNDDINRFKNFHIQYDDFLVDFSKNRITLDYIEDLDDIVKIFKNFYPKINFNYNTSFSTLWQSILGSW